MFGRRKQNIFFLQVIEDKNSRKSQLYFVAILEILLLFYEKLNLLQLLIQIKSHNKELIFYFYVKLL